MGNRLENALARSVALSDEQKTAVREKFSSLNEAEQNKVLYMLEHEEELILASADK